MRITVVDCGSKRLQNILNIVGRTDATTVSVPLQGANEHLFTNCDAVIISGGPHLFTDDKQTKLLPRFDFINRLNVPVLGICLGHQALGLHHGATVFRAQARRQDEHITRLLPHPLLENVAQSFTLRADHCEGISCPDSFFNLAGSEYYQNEIMANDTLCRYGIQAHPEVSGKTGNTIIKNFLRLASPGHK